MRETENVTKKIYIKGSTEYINAGLNIASRYSSGIEEIIMTPTHFEGDFPEEVPVTFK